MLLPDNKDQKEGLTGDLSYTTEQLKLLQLDWLDIQNLTKNKTFNRYKYIIFLFVIHSCVQVRTKFLMFMTRTSRSVVCTFTSNVSLPSASFYCHLFSSSLVFLFLHNGHCISNTTLLL